MLNAAIRYRWIITFMLSAVIVISLTVYSVSSPSTWLFSAHNADINLASSNTPGVPPLSHPVLPDGSTTQVTESRAELFSSSATVSILYFLFSVFAIFSIMRWREWRDRNKTKKNQKVMEKSSVDIEAVARKLQQRLPENRVVRDRVASNLPRNRSKPVDSIPSNPFGVQRQPNLSKILIVDSNQEFRLTLSNLLHRYYSTLESTELEEALRIARIARPALIILGSQASKKECMAFCRKLKSDSALWHIPLLLLLPKKSNGDATHLIKATDDYLTVPVQSAELLMSVENLVDVRRYLKQGGLKKPVINADDSTTQISDTMFLEAVHTVVENNLSNSLFGLETLAQEVNVTIRQLHGRLRKLTRLSPAGFIRTKRLKKAIDLLTAATMPVEEVASEVGFHSAEYFNRVFRQAFGVLPVDYNKEV